MASQSLDDAFDSLLSLEETSGEAGFQQGHQEGFADGVQQGEDEGRELGRIKGQETGAEVGFYRGCAELIQLLGPTCNPRVQVRLKKTCASLGAQSSALEPNATDDKLTDLLEKMRGQHKLVSSLIGSKNSTTQNLLNF